MKNEIMGKRTTWADVGRLYRNVQFEHDGERCVALVVRDDGLTPRWRSGDGGKGWTQHWESGGVAFIPLLRRLESITLDEQKDLAIAVGWELDQWDAVFTEGDLTTNICEEHPLTYLDRFVGYPKAILWLLDNHFCLWEELFEYGEVGELQV